MMSPDWLQAKTWGNRMIGYTALHCCCNGSDKKLQRADICRMLIAAQADIEARNDNGVTPFLLACGTGLLDVAQALSHLGADVHAIADERNAADRSYKSSGNVYGWPLEMKRRKWSFSFFKYVAYVFLYLCHVVGIIILCMLFYLSCLVVTPRIVAFRWLDQQLGVRLTGTTHTGRWRGHGHVSWGRQLRYDEGDAMGRRHTVPRGESLPPWKTR